MGPYLKPGSVRRSPSALSRPFRFTSIVLLAACVVILSTGTSLIPTVRAADSAAAADQAVALPPFMVEEMAKGPPWRYAESVGYEILSRCDDSATRRVVDSHYVLHQLLAEILPPALQVSFSMPKALILYDEELNPAASREVISRMMRDSSTPANDIEINTGFRNMRVSPPKRPVSFLPNLRLWDRDAMTVFMIVRREDAQYDRLALTQDYVSYLVKSRTPMLPPWFIYGFLELYREMKYEGSRIDLPPLVWISDMHTDLVKKTPATAPRVAPLGEMLAARLPEREPLATFEPLQAWQATAQLFVRWGIDPAGGARRAAFWKFTERSVIDGPTEKLFTECFGMDFAAAQAQLTTYLSTAVRREVSFKPAKLQKLPPLALRNASDGEIGRLKGEWERLEITYVKNLYPELAPKYLDQARRTLKRVYDRNERDPRFLAVMGLCEADAGNDPRALELLESAAAIGPLRPRASYELARLRLAAARREPAGKNGRLGVTQTAEVLKPLFDARAANPLLPEVYDLIAEAWQASAATPTRRHLAVLDEGVRIFPRRTELVLRTAELNLAHGFREEASTFVSIGERLANDEASKQRVAALRQKLAAK